MLVLGSGSKISCDMVQERDPTRHVCLIVCMLVINNNNNKKKFSQLKSGGTQITFLVRQTNIRYDDVQQIAKHLYVMVRNMIYNPKIMSFVLIAFTICCLITFY